MVKGFLITMSVMSSFIGLVVLCNYWGLHWSTSIQLSEDYLWKTAPDGSTQELVCSGTQLISGDAIYMWCKHPYICGIVIKDRVVRDFVIDIPEKSIKYMSTSEMFRFLTKQNLRKIKYVGFYDLKGQWGNKEKLIELQNEVQGKGKWIPPVKLQDKAIEDIGVGFSGLLRGM